MNWVDDIGAEDVMKQLGIKWESATISMKDIDVKLSRQNFAREERLDKDHAESIAIAARNGSRIPKCVVRKKSTPTGKRFFVIASGNHRHESAVINGENDLPCYVVVCTDGEFELLCKLANTTPGKGADKPLRVKQAAHAVITGKLTEQDAATLFGVSKASVNFQKRLIVAKEKVAARLGERARISDKVIMSLAAIQADSVFNAAVDYAKGSALDSKGTADAIKKASAESEAKAISFLGSLERKQRSGDRKVRSERRIRFLGVLTQLENTFRESQTLDVVDVPEEMKKEVRQRCLAIANLLKSL